MMWNLFADWNMVKNNFISGPNWCISFLDCFKVLLWSYKQSKDICGEKTCLKTFTIIWFWIFRFHWTRIIWFIKKNIEKTLKDLIDRNTQFAFRIVNVHLQKIAHELWLFMTFCHMLHCVGGVNNPKKKCRFCTCFLLMTLILHRILTINLHFENQILKVLTLNF